MKGYLHGYGTRKSVGVNGWLGYLLTEEEYKYGGYEPTVSPFTPGAASDLTEDVVTYLQGKIL
jgi:neutral ceramidase